MLSNGEKDLRRARNPSGGTIFVLGMSDSCVKQSDIVL